MAWRDLARSSVSYVADHWVRVLIAVVVVGVAVFAVRPFETVPDPSGDDIAVAWNESIGRLGITPIYPPTEDLSVGDVWGIITEIDKNDSAQQLNSTPLLGKAVRIGHIDLRDQILQAFKQPTFADTVEPANGSKIWKQERWEMPQPDAATKGRIPLALTAFPGVTINHQSRTGAQMGAATGWFGVQRHRDQQEQILIKSAESYGVPTMAAVYFLNKWCTDNDNKELCQDANVRRALSYAVGQEVLEATGTPKRYTYRIGLQLVTRVFLMRQIEHRSSSDIARAIALQAGDAKPEAAPTGSTSAIPKQSGASIDVVTQNLTPAITAGSRVAQVSADGLVISLIETFQRPIAFGYRNVTMALKPSSPED